MNASDRPSPEIPVSPAPVYPAATVMVVRDGPTGVEVLMLERRRGGSFSGAFVFPGGRVDDADAALYGLCDGIDDEHASAELSVRKDGLAYRIAAVREVFEESGILLATQGAGSVGPELARSLADERENVARGRLSFGALCEQAALRIDAASLEYVSFWVTPATLRYRFSTRFFVVGLPDGQEADHDGGETVSSVWVSPADALTEEGRRRYRLHMPTVANLKSIAGFAAVADVMGAHVAIDKCSIREILPEPVETPDGRLMTVRGDPAYPPWRPTS